jgi:hypothetical protein
VNVSITRPITAPAAVPVAALGLGLAARRERILSTPRRPVSETNFSLRAREAGTAQEMRGDREPEAK